MDMTKLVVTHYAFRKGKEDEVILLCGFSAAFIKSRGEIHEAVTAAGTQLRVVTGDNNDDKVQCLVCRRSLLAHRRGY